ncbi:MAG: glycoside hydrolase family 2 protein [Oscillospiraceae bacterium]|nr:glycoside hydrolase family 2 protein [Oscillospiraceae bacterium]
MIQSLNGEWQLNRVGFIDKFPVNIPNSVYGAMLAAEKRDDPYYGENQYDATELSDGEYLFEKSFEIAPEISGCKKIYLRFHGVDTLADIELNGVKVGKTENMHCVYEFDVTNAISRGGNILRVKIHSPIEYITKKQQRNYAWGVETTMDGFPHIRKAHYMFGWDWGPQLPDLGIWRDVELVGVDSGRIESVYVRQEHLNNAVRLVFDTRLADINSNNLRLDVCITPPEGEEILISVPASKEALTPECVISDPMLWQVKGYGKQYLYMVKVMLFNGDEPVDMQEFNVGLRKITVLRTPDNDGTDGEEFTFCVNGIKIFAMGANYIPEDQILSRCNAERTRKLLKSCAAANYNMIRVWGGGIYPDDYFFDMCDKLGILVWQDFAFACAVYNADIDFCTNIKQEFIDNVKRIRNHASLAMWCGNNEIESLIQYWGKPVTEAQKEGYLRIFEKLIPNVLKHYDPQTFYWPSSPSSGGGYNDSSADNKGDTHYWDVWHGLKPFTEFRKFKFRFCSEYGFESIPCMKTIRSFAEEKDLNLCSPVMEAHQKCEGGNEKLLYYLAQMVHYPYSFEGLSYATQIVQADAIRTNVEHMRRNRGRCMGSLYWQVNDSNPVISWSSIDYFGRWKALHYYAKKFYAPVLCSIDDSNKKKLVVNVSNEKLSEFKGEVRWRVRRNDTEIIAQGIKDVVVPSLSAKDVLTLTPEMTKLTDKMLRNHYIEYALVQNGTVVSVGTLMLVLPKQFEFLNPEISVNVDQIGEMYRLELNSRNYAKGVYLDFDEYDCIFGDNWFDLHGQKHSLLVSKSYFPMDTTIESIKEKLCIKSYYDIT